MTYIIGLDREEGRKPWQRSLGEFLREAVARNPDKVFLEIVGHGITYQECLRRSAQTSDMFRELGVSRGDRVTLFLPNCPEFLYCWFGLSMMGAISVPVNTAYKRDETAYILNNSEALALVAHQSLLTVAGPAAQLAPSLRYKLVVSIEEQEAPPLTEDWIDFSESWGAGSDNPGPDKMDLHQVSPQDISMLVYTSGTTGNPKGVQVTHQMYVSAGQGFAHWTRATLEDRFFTCLPFFHANAQYYSTMGALAAGGTLVVVDRVQRLAFLGAGQAGQSHGGELHWYDDAGAFETDPFTPRSGESGTAVLRISGLFSRVPGGISGAFRYQDHSRLWDD